MVPIPISGYIRFGISVNMNLVSVLVLWYSWNTIALHCHVISQEKVLERKLPISYNQFMEGGRGGAYDG